MKTTPKFLALAFFAFATPMFAQSSPNIAGWVAVTSGFSMAIASAICGLAQAKAAAAAAEGMARNPAASAAIRMIALLALVFIESLALYTLIIIATKVTT